MCVVDHPGHDDSVEDVLPPTRPHRAWLGWLAVCCAGSFALAAAATVGADTERAAAQVAPEEGGELYQRWCATCHATDGSGTSQAPSLEDVDVAYLDLTMRTGRMPLADPLRGVRERRFTDTERVQTVAYLADLLDLDGEIPVVVAGDAAVGREVYEIHCAACHGPGGEGGLAGDGTPVPGIVHLDPVAVAEATRVGPFEMPAFSEELVADDEVAHLAAFLDPQARPPPTPLGLVVANRALASAFALALALTIIGLCVWVSRLPDRAPEEDGGAVDGAG